MKVCSQCGSQSSDNVNFCSQCGAVLPHIEQQQEQQQSAYQQSEQQQNSYQQQQPNYQQNSYQRPLTPPPDAKGKAITALVLGIVGVVTFWIGWFNIISLAISIVGIVFAMKARNEIPVGYDGRSMATAGLICAIIGTVLSGIGVLSCTLCTTCISCANTLYY